MAKYPINERQTDHILDLRLYQLTGLEREKIEKERAELLLVIADLEAILAQESVLLGVIKKELLEHRERFNNPRKTQFLAADGEMRMEDLIANEGCIITVSHNGFIKRTPVSNYRSQRRGGKGVIGTGSYEEDFVEHLFTASTHDYVMFFMSNGRVYVEKVYDIPEGTRTSKGRSISNVLEMQKDEKLAAMICIKEFSENEFLMMATRQGQVKKTALSEYVNFRKGGIIGIKITEGDTLIGVKLLKPEDEVVLITHEAMSIRFKESDARPMGRDTQGVRGISLGDGDFVETIEVVDKVSTLLVAAEDGQGKRSDFEEYRVQGRGGSGVRAMKLKEGSAVAGALSVREEDEIMMLTHSGQAVRTRVKEIRVIGRTTQGVRLINLAEGDKLIGISKIVEVDEDEA